MQIQSLRFVIILAILCFKWRHFEYGPGTEKVRRKYGGGIRSVDCNIMIKTKAAMLI